MNHIPKQFGYARAVLDLERRAFLRALSEAVRAGVPAGELMDEVDGAMSAARQIVAWGEGA